MAGPTRRSPNARVGALNTAGEPTCTPASSAAAREPNPASTQKSSKPSSASRWAEVSTWPLAATISPSIHVVVAGEHADRLADGVAALGTGPTIALCRVQQQLSTFGDKPDDVADLIHVRLHQHPRSRAADVGDHVARRIAADGLAARGPTVFQQRGEFHLGPGRSRHRTQLRQHVGQIHPATLRRAGHGVASR